ncbi:hypothetical protein CU098_007202 [Rhizopus stolonifer]|uniref:Uncharacterized protein n=1 Tax=Rhizopus stolonifer TaxID=4846 RepID=A0A367IT60_RHIST|nr:hypothetical protein CU098_007202 [Rhizopus stolonifer]
MNLHVEIVRIQQDEMTGLLDRDWLQYLQMRYCTSQLLVVAILVEGSTSIAINTVEPYSRDILLDAHHEQKLFDAATSFPSAPDRYGFLSICQLSTPDDFKLTIGSLTCSFLVTSSLRLDIISVSLGSVTTHFMPSPTIRLFLDVGSIAAYDAFYVLAQAGEKQIRPFVDLHHVSVGFDDYFAAGVITVDILNTVVSKVEPGIRLSREG